MNTGLVYSNLWWTGTKNNKNSVKETHFNYSTDLPMKN